MDMLVLLVIAVLVVCFFNSSIFYSRKDWEKEIKKYDIEKESVKIYDLPAPIKIGVPNISMASNKVINLSEIGLKKVYEGVKNCGNYFLNKTYRSACEKIDDIAKEIKINTSFRGMVLVFWLCIICYTAHIMKDFINFIKEMSFYNVLDIIIAISTIGLLGIMVYFLIRDIGGIISLKKTEDTKTKVENLIKTNNANELKRYLLSLNLSKDDEKELKTEFKNKQDAREVVISYERIVLKKYDEKVHNVIKEYRNKVIIGNGISGSSMLDCVVNLYCFYQILRNVARIYKIRLGLTSMFRILVAGCLVCYVVAKGTNWFVELFDNAVIKEILGKFVYPFKLIVQALTSGFSMQIYGYWLQYALRPVEAYNINMKNESIKKYVQKACNDNELSEKDFISDII